VSFEYGRFAAQTKRFRVSRNRYSLTTPDPRKQAGACQESRNQGGKPGRRATIPPRKHDRGGATRETNAPRRAARPQRRSTECPLRLTRLLWPSARPAAMPPGPSADANLRARTT
jgi:hypothetical protein